MSTETPDCKRTLALHKPGIPISGKKCSYSYSGKTPNTGRQVCHLCGGTKPSIKESILKFKEYISENKDELASIKQHMASHPNKYNVSSISSGQGTKFVHINNMPSTIHARNPRTTEEEVNKAQAHLNKLGNDYRVHTTLPIISKSGGRFNDGGNED